jgi:hypothetical protein
MAPKYKSSDGREPPGHKTWKDKFILIFCKNTAGQKKHL